MEFFRSIAVCVWILVTASMVGAQGVRFKIASMAPDGSSWMQEARKGAAEINERTDGRVSFRFYPGGTMGGDQMVLRKMRIGQLHGGVLLAGSLADVAPDFEIYNLPLMFRSYVEVDYVRERMDRKLIGQLAGEGYVVFGFMETGFTYLMSTKPTRSFSDLRGRKAWMPEGDPVSKAIMDAAGLSAVPLPVSDVLTGLQTGLIDTVAAPPVGAVALQWFTKATYITDLPITYIYGAVVVSEKAFSRLNAGDREIVSEVLWRVTEELDGRTRIDNQNARKALVKQGVTFVLPQDETRVRWREVAAEATDRLIALQHYDTELVAEIEGLLTAFREISSATEAD